MITLTRGNGPVAQLGRDIAAARAGAREVPVQRGAAGQHRPLEVHAQPFAGEILHLGNQRLAILPAPRPEPGERTFSLIEGGAGGDGGGLGGHLTHGAFLLTEVAI